jgi:hypothetical protein
VVPEDRQLLVELARVNRCVPEFVLAFIDGKISPDDQLAFASKLVELADAITRHAHERKRVVIDGTPKADLDLRPAAAFATGVGCAFS